MMKPVAGEAKMNKAEGHEPKSGHSAPAPAAGVGGEGKANTSGAGIGGASAELRKQHPIAHHDHGPHHGTTHHIRHEPVGKVYR